ncbi:hypothetical protein TRVL_01653 [Trypanosoma vivax]|nr:hypothetical protein TRVL_01653 [Trypanosoma vivax]
MTHQVSSFPFTLGILQSNASKTRSLFLNNSFLLLHISGGCQGRPRHYFVGTMNEKGSFKAVGMGKTISFCSGRRGEGGKEWDSYLCPPLKNIFIACSRARFCTTQTCTEIQNVTFFFFVCLFVSPIAQSLADIKHNSNCNPQLTRLLCTSHYVVRCGFVVVVAPLSHRKLPRYIIIAFTRPAISRTIAGTSQVGILEKATLSLQISASSHNVCFL